MRKTLCVLTYKNPSDETRGKTRRYLYEERPNVFVGVISRNVMDTLWKEIEKSGESASLTYTDDTEQGFSIRTTMPEESSRFTEIDGLWFPCTRKPKLAADDLYAKADPAKKLKDHLKEAGTIAYELLNSGRGKRALKVMSERFSGYVTEEELRSFIAFLCASHDIGKAHPGFQKQLAEKDPDIKDVVNRLVDKKMILNEDNTVRHERYSREIIEEHLKNKGFTDTFAKECAYIIAYHHQGKGSGIYKQVDCTYLVGERKDEWERVQKEIIDELEEMWPISENIKSLYNQNGLDGLTYYILSVMVVSDWIASGSLWEKTKERCGEDIKKAAFAFVKEQKLDYEPIKDALKDAIWDKLFDFPKNELQTTISNMDLSDTSLLLIEYPCGYGKTEAALLAAYIIGASYGGIYVAAPTQSTAKGLLKGRISELAQKAGLPFNIPEFDESMVWSDDDMLKIPKDLWTSKTRHQFLYPYAVGTIDQALKCILSFRYSCIGILGLTDKVVIIDEVHAYQTYMVEEIETLIRWCRFFKVPVIMLSATLPTRTKQKYFEAASGKKDFGEIQPGYPMISMIKNRELIQVTTECKGREFPISTIETSDLEETMVKEALAHKEGCLALIMPTVDSAFSLYDKVCEVKKDCDIVIFQGRDTVSQKTGKTELLLKLLGKNRENRPKNMIVIATSIIEQSLDIDFDRIVTALAPVDLLIQRMGRLWRHSDKGTIREKEEIKDPFTVLVPDKYGSLSYIYDESILDNAKKVIHGIKKINTIFDVRKLIDSVYDHELKGDRKSEMYAGFNCLGKPFGKTPSIISDGEEAYARFNHVLAQTREESYRTIQIAIIEKEPEECSYEDVKKIMAENVVNVPYFKVFDKNDIPYFPVWENGIEWLKDIPVFIGGKEMTVHGTKGKMALTKDELRFTHALKILSLRHLENL